MTISQVIPANSFLGLIRTGNGPFGGTTDADRAMGLSSGSAQLSNDSISYLNMINAARAVISPVAKCRPGQTFGDVPNERKALRAAAESVFMKRRELNSSASSPPELWVAVARDDVNEYAHALGDR